MLHVAVDEAFTLLLSSWREHWLMQRRPDVPVDVLAESRLRLDRARERMRRLRLAVHPEPTECETVVDVVWCEPLATVVHLRWEDREPARPGNFGCPCGGLVPIDWERVASRRSEVEPSDADPRSGRQRRWRGARTDRLRSDGG